MQQRRRPSHATLQKCIRQRGAARAEIRFPEKLGEIRDNANLHLILGTNWMARAREIHGTDPFAINAAGTGDRTKTTRSVIPGGEGRKFQRWYDYTFAGSSFTTTARS